MRLINKGLVVFALLCNVVIVIDVFFKTNTYEKYLYFNPLHNTVAVLLLVMVIVQVAWLFKGYFASSKWVLYAMILNIVLFIVQCLYFIKTGDL